LEEYQGGVRGQQYDHGPNRRRSRAQDADATASTPPETDASLVLSRRRELSEATPADLADLDERTGAGDEGTGAEPRGAGVAFLALAAAVVVAALLALRRGA